MARSTDLYHRGAPKYEFTSSEVGAELMEKLQE